MILRVVATGRRVGRVAILSHGKVVFEGMAKGMFSLHRKRLGEREAAKALLEEGWSNGYVYLDKED